VSSDGAYFERLDNGGTRLLFAEQSVRVGRHHMTIHGFNFPREGAKWNATCADFLIDASCESGMYTLTFTPADSKFQRGLSQVVGVNPLLHVDTLYAFAALVAKLGPLDIQKFGVDVRALECHPVNVNPCGEFVDLATATRGSGIDVSVPVRGDVLRNVLPSIMATKYEPDLLESTQYLHNCFQVD